MVFRPEPYKRGFFLFLNAGGGAGGKIQKIPIGGYPVYLMSTKNNLGTCCSAIAVKRFPLHVERVNVYPDEKF